MSNLFKIKNLCKSLAKEFGDMQEGQGYQMLYNMIDKEEKSVPATIHDLWKSINDRFVELGVPKDTWSYEITIYSPRHVRFKTWCVGESIDAEDPKSFYTKVIGAIDRNIDKIRKDNEQKIVKSDISI